MGRKRPHCRANSVHSRPRSRRPAAERWAARLTISPPAALLGAQKPRVLTRPPFQNEDAGQEAIDLAESVGLHLDPWQQLIVRVALAEDERGLYAAREVGYLVARQNGKGGVLEAIALHGLFLVGDPLTLWTAHQFKTSSEAFLRMKGWIDGSDDLRRKVKRVVSAHGDEGFELTAGPRLRFIARSKSSGRGFSPQRIFFDEAQELPKVATEAMLPSMRAQRNRQAIYTGTVPGPEINNPEHWARLRDRGRAGAGRLAWLEWSPKGSDVPELAEKIDLDDERNWTAANPGVGFRDGLDVDSISADRESLDDDSFARECLSIWPTVPELDMDAAFGKGKWQACLANMEPEKPAAVGIAVSVDRLWSSIGAATAGAHIGSFKSPDGLPSRRAGTAWVVAEAKRLQDTHGCAVVVDSKGPAESLIDDLETAGVAVTTTTTDEYVGACAALFDAVQDAAVTHAGDELLSEAVGRAESRKVGDRWAWARRAGDISMLEAVTLAHWARSKPTREFWGAFG